ncbi:MAG: helix-turn-helix domain-containing protein [Planctomycetes bacterium]|nr:helix-turn-helix domain-containing protein [Planctomycetota bacterium]
MDINHTIAARITDLVHEYSQAAVARAGGVNESSVYHYQRGRRVPADFCVKLSESLGVNLNWLLTGMGAPQAGETTLQADAVGESMERMVRVLGALESEAEGTLKGAPSARRFEKLNEMLKTWDQANERLNSSLLPVADRLGRSMNDAMDRMNLTRAGDIKPGLEYLKRFDLPSDTINQIDLTLARFAFLDLDYEHDFELRQKILWRYLIGGGSDPREVLKYAFAVVHSGYGMGRHAEAVMMADGVLAATRIVPERDKHRLRLRIVRSSCLVELGRVSEAIAELSDAVPRLPDDMRNRFWGLHIRTLVLAGSMEIAPAFSVIEGYAYPQDDTALFSLAFLESDKSLLQRALKFAERTGAVHPDTTQPTNWLHGQCWMQAMDGDARGAVKRWLAAVEGARVKRTRKAALAFIEIELLRVGGNEKLARARLRQFWNAHEHGLPGDIFQRAVMYRETLRLEPANVTLHARARVWLRRMVRQGYVYFRNWLAEPAE